MEMDKQESFSFLISKLLNITKVNLETALFLHSNSLGRLVSLTFERDGGSMGQANQIFKKRLLRFYLINRNVP